MNAFTHSDVKEVLDFWFGDTQERGKNRVQWFQKDSTFDDEIRARFLTLHEAALSGKLMAWKDSAESCLALIILLDQFPRNMFREDARAFSGDAMARDVAKYAVANGYDRALNPVERVFVYLPWEHSESLKDQEEGIQLMKSLTEFPETRETYTWAEKHRDIIQKFGRFPHRNIILDRISTDDEVAFLKQPGSAF